MDMIPLSSGKYRVVDFLRQSKARYATGIHIGDILEFRLDLIPTGGGANGNYALNIAIFVNGVKKAVCTQNEVFAIFHPKFKPIFQLEEVTS